MLSLLSCTLPSTTHIAPHHLLNFKKLINNAEPHVFKPIKSNSTLAHFNACLKDYVSAGLMLEAHQLFDEMPERTLVSWTILMSGYARHGPVSETLSVFQEMMGGCHCDFRLQPDSVVYAIVLRACAALGNVCYGRELHCRILKSGDGVVDSFVENALVTMYASSGFICDSIRVFDGISRPDLVSWSSMLSGYVQNGLEEEGLRLFVRMIEAGVQPDVFVLSRFISACANLGCLGPGVQVHCNSIKMGFRHSLFLQNCLIDFYARCGDCGSSEKVFYQLPRKDLVSYNAIISGYVHNFFDFEALRVFQVLISEGLSSDDFTLVGVLRAVIGLGALNLGREIHGYIIRAGFESNLYVISSLLEMYIECMDHESLISSNHVPPKIFNCLEGGKSDKFIVASILKWCSLRLDLETGQTFHSQIIRSNLQSDPHVVSSLIDMYSKCGIPEAASTIFFRVKDKTVVPWSVIIAGYCWNGWFDQSLSLFRRMQFDLVEANEYTYTSVLLACLALADLGKIKEVHGRILRTGFESRTSIINMLIYLYLDFSQNLRALALCLLIPEAKIPWDLLIEAFVRTEHQELIPELICRIQRSNGRINSTSVRCILHSCAKLTLLNVGTQAQAYLIKRGLICDPSTSNALIEMYSECGMIADAVSTFNSMQEKNSESWTSIISANVNHGQPSKAMDLFTQMCRNHESVKSGTFTSILRACAQMRLVHEAIRLFFSMREIHGIEPSLEHQTCIVEVLGRAGMFEEAQKFINSVIPLKSVPQVWKILLSTSRVHGNTNIAKYSTNKLLALEPKDFAANSLLQHFLLSEGKWNEALNLKRKKKTVVVNSAWIEIRNRIHEFASFDRPTEYINTKLMEIENDMKELGYIADKKISLHNAEEEFYGCGGYHNEMKALALGLLELELGAPIRVLKSSRMCGDCHSAFKFVSILLGRELVVKDSCNFHHFINGKCSCRDAW
ncbi:hypothetical protein Sjap_001224 [Stephania japonica]|uniref:DYW domain-containing protein n=1 Tax=Stephania japonica TaxID=461633 RepID=A0AAP0PTA6_9MAGN